MLILNTTVVFRNLCHKKYPNKSFWVPNLGTFVLSQNFAIRQIWGCWFQLWQCHFQIPVQKYWNFCTFIFSWNLAIRQIRGKFEGNFRPKYRNLTFVVRNLGIFNFCTKLSNKTNWRVLISNYKHDYKYGFFKIAAQNT